jgi:Flp pilus assembly secretin CpaC
VGVKVFFRPKIMSNGRINLFVTPKVSEPPQDIGQGSFFIASRNTRNNVEINPGDTMVLSGLFEMNDAANVNKFPWLADIPIIGELFKNRANEKTKQELVFFVTPEIINSPADASVGSDMPVRTQEFRDFLNETEALGPVRVPDSSGDDTVPRKAPRSSAVTPSASPEGAGIPVEREAGDRPSAGAEASRRMADLLREARPSGVPTEVAAAPRASLPDPKLR